MIPPGQQDFAETYRHFSDEDIAALYAEKDTLTGEARKALAAEIGRRGISEIQLARIHHDGRRLEAKFDRRERRRRKMVGEFLLAKWRRRLIVAALALVVLLLIFERISRHH